MAHDIASHREDFLWQTFFGITPAAARECPEEALLKCIRRAYRDPDRTLDFLFSASKLDSEDIATLETALAGLLDGSKASGNRRADLKRAFNGFKEDFKTSQMEPFLAEGAKGLLALGEIDDEGKRRESFDEAHRCICSGIIEKSLLKRGDTPLFKTPMTYGQAQKWLNMTMKYLWLMGLWEEHGMGRIASCLHAPIDNYVLGEALHDERLGFWNAGAIEKAGGSYRIVADDGLKYAWSHIPDSAVYDGFRKKLEARISERGLTPIEWEHETWLNAASK